MTTANHPENQKNNGPHDLSQISQAKDASPNDETEARHRNLNYPWVIVEGVGCDDEQIATEHRTFSDAWKKLHAAYDTDEIDVMPVEIMKRQPDGTLTTEY